MFDQDDILDGLNEQQRRATTHVGGPLLVLAGAGTGKTRTLVARAAWLRDAPAASGDRPDQGSGGRRARLAVG